jgi:glycosyltransferase involved in cell wall biosynthesis
MSVVIAAKDAADTLAEQLDALLPQAWSGSWEIVVVDNGSTDTTREIVRSFESRCRRVRLVEATNRSGAGYARNVAMRASSARAFAFCDADDIVTAGWVSAMGDGLRRHEAVGGSVELQLLNAPWLQTAYYASPPQRLETFEGIFPFAATCSLGVRRSVIEHVGGFDEDFVTGQDMELCLRIWHGGHELVHAPDATVHYRYRASMRALWRRSLQYGAVGPEIARRLRELGGPAPPPWRGARQWVWLVRNLPRLRAKAGRARWIVVAGTKVGRLIGSARARVLYL